jgi:hypothetical protein
VIRSKILGRRHSWPRITAKCPAILPMTVTIMIVPVIGNRCSWKGLYVDFALLILEPVLWRGRLGLHTYERRSTAPRHRWPVPWTNLLRHIGHLIHCRFALLPSNVAFEIKDNGPAVLFHGFQKRIHVDMQPSEIRLIQLLTRRQNSRKKAK